MPFDSKLYPKNWPDIRRRILLRAHNRCERCGVRNHAVGYRDKRGHFTPICGTGPHDAAGYGLAWPSLDPLPYREACEFRDSANDEGEERYLVIVLTVAHVDNPDPMDCRDENLAALCQLHHLQLDAAQHGRNAAATRRRRRTAGQLTLEEMPC